MVCLMILCRGVFSVSVARIISDRVSGGLVVYSGSERNNIFPGYKC